MLVPRLVRQALQGQDLTVYGDGAQSRCFCHVSDTVNGLLGLLDRPEAIGDVFNVGSEEEVTINELAELVLEVTGSGSRVVHVPYEKAYPQGFEDMTRRVPDTAKIRQLTGWRPRYSLRDTLADIVTQERPAQPVITA